MNAKPKQPVSTRLADSTRRETTESLLKLSANSVPPWCSAVNDGNTRGSAAAISTKLIAVRYAAAHGISIAVAADLRPLCRLCQRTTTAITAGAIQNITPPYIERSTRINCHIASPSVQTVTTISAQRKLDIARFMFGRD